MTISLNAFLSIGLSALCQLVMTIVFAKEALSTPVGTLCWLKCSLATGFYFLTGFMLAWFLLASSIDFCPA